MCLKSPPWNLSWLPPLGRSWLCKVHLGQFWSCVLFLGLGCWSLSLQSSTRVLEDQQAVHEVSSLVSTHGSGDPGPMDGRRKTPPLKSPRLHTEIMFSESVLVTAPEFNEVVSKEEDPKVGAQEAEQAPDSAPVQHLEEPATGSDQPDTPGQESGPPQGVVPPQVAAPAAAVELGLGSAASADITDAPLHVPEESSLEPVLVATTGEELALQSAHGPVLELRIIPPALPLPPEVVLPPLFDLLLLYCLIVVFSISPQHD
ncbi:hypothetical protein HJG60_011960 [Phyllostomus discolor]|uniref:Uncharacterized protein n=1 Tax=Phyllostomus discolor TaxID=89673 RepID=A0A833ZLW1_9CHIR|nr:hypothetical protein HJG60_011960 [Phyllostomus discolor]